MLTTTCKAIKFSDGLEPPYADLQSAGLPLASENIRRKVTNRTPYYEIWSLTQAQLSLKLPTHM